MKRMLFFCAALLAVLTCNAQSVLVLKDGKLIAEFYERDGWKFVFKEKEQEDPYNGHEYVDLGLPSGLKWATMNVGATKPEEYGDYYAWGETEPYYTEGHSQDTPCTNWREGKTGYDSESYFDSNYAKYATDKKTVLEADDDVAHVKWGGDWRMPTHEEMKELLTECLWTWTTSGNVKGYIVTGPNGNTIFLPAAGRRIYSKLEYERVEIDYLSSSLCLYGSENPINAWGLSNFTNGVCETRDRRYCGRSVRPVCP